MKIDHDAPAPAGHARAPFRRRGAAVAAFVAAIVWLVTDMSRAVEQPGTAASPAGASDGMWLAARRALSTLAPAACRGYSPTVRWNGRTVFVDAGHGGADPGATGAASGDRLVEKDVTLAIALRTLPALRAAGFRVVLSRRDDRRVARPRPSDVSGDSLTAAGLKRELEARNACANAVRADALVSVHLNSFADPAVGGSQTLYNANRSFSARSRALARLLQTSIVTSLATAGMATSDRGVSTDEGLGGDALSAEAAAYGQLMQLGPPAPPWFRIPTQMPGAVVEPLFITSGQEGPGAATVDGQTAMARGIVRGLERYFA